MVFMSPRPPQRAQGTLGSEWDWWSRLRQACPHFEGLSLCFGWRTQLVW